MNFLSVLYAKAGITVDGVTTLNNTATGQTPATNDNSTKLATTGYVKNQNYYPYPTGTTAQYVRGDGSLATFTQTGGGGSSVSYYLNGSVSQGTIGGNAYYEMSKNAIIGTNADFSINADGYVAQFVTDAGDPALLSIPGGNWNFEMFFSASSGGGTPSFYVELYKYDGTTLTLIASGSAAPESITGGTSTDLYITALAVPTTTLTLTDRLAVRVYVNHSGRTITLHTQNGHLCQVITSFTTGLTALNGLTAQVQNFAVGTGGTDFNILSVTDTHTFNLPTASATKRGALSSIDWSAFDAKVDFGDLSATSPLNYNGSGVFSIAQSSTSTNGYLSSTDWTTFNNKIAGSGTANYIAKFTSGSVVGNSIIYDNGTSVGIGTATPTGKLEVAENGGGTWISANKPTLFISNGGTSNAYYALGIKTNSGEIFSVTNAGNVGIGTSSPAATLDVRSKAASGSITAPTFRAFGYDTDSYFQVNSNASNSADIKLTRSDATTMFEINGHTGLAYFNGNIGVGVTPSAWTSFSVLQNTGGSLIGAAGELQLWQNAYYDGASKYYATGTATRYGMTAGQHRWYYAVSGTANAALTWVQAMTLDASGQLLIGTTTSSSYKLDVNGTARVSGALTANNGIFNGVSSTNLKVQNGANANTLFLIQSFGTEALGENASILFKSAANSTDTTYAKGLISFVNNGTGYGRGSLIFATNNSADSANVTASDVRLTIAANGAATFSSSVTATNFIGAGTGLTGTASALSIGGNAATATIATDLNAADSTQINFNDVTNTNYSTMTFMSRAWAAVQGANGLAYRFDTHTDGGSGGYAALQIYYGESGYVFAPTSFRAPRFYSTLSSGTMFSNNSMVDSIGYNTSYGTYIGSAVGGTYYLYANGTFYDGSVVRTLIHSGNIGSQSVAYATTAGALTSMNISQFTNDAGYITSTSSTFSYTASVTLSPTWQNTGVSSANLGTGTYLVNCFANDAGVGGGQYDCTYAGIMYFYAGGTNGSNANEIVLHHTGHADNGRYIYLRTLSTVTADGKTYLQISGNGTNSGASNYQLTFKKLL